MVTSRIRATYLAGQVLTFEQRQTSVVADSSPRGLARSITATADRLPTGLGALGFSDHLHADPGTPL